MTAWCVAGTPTFSTISRAGKAVWITLGPLSAIDDPLSAMLTCSRRTMMSASLGYRLCVAFARRRRLSIALSPPRLVPPQSLVSNALNSIRPQFLITQLQHVRTHCQ